MYRIGEIAKRADVSKRTIDYYTQLGLLQVEKTSSSNYRLYSENALDDIHFIEKCKELKMSLNEIKDRLEWKRADVLQQAEHEKYLKQAQILASHMKQLEDEITELQPLFDRLSIEEKTRIAKMLSPEKAALLQSLAILFF
ncbi:MerR family transcriptional regulator [Metabacillus sp. GX 13764]|uniref:MerR family transcriptional regulator n=1 Tax=Metabacillus kandeliae TaxID=2900151 RepID=UPI001E4A4CA7|nr:MerR family transcriptional regulator [Metabacillus kandeliae]MCD7036218.1 MerR family transcriptional regulator [Metabacillus kandeliae]